MSRQQSCRDMCKNLALMYDMYANRSELQFHHIWIIMSSSIVSETDHSAGQFPITQDEAAKPAMKLSSHYFGKNLCIIPMIEKDQSC